jgi:hypothetical protein
VKLSFCILFVGLGKITKVTERHMRSGAQYLQRLPDSVEGRRRRHHHPEASQGRVREACAEQHVVREG